MGDETTGNAHNVSHITTGVGGPKLFKALAAFQATRPTAVMDGVNPHFKSKYAGLASVTEAARGACEFGLAVPQLVHGDVVITVLGHESGEWLRTETRIIATKNNVHGYGSGITYARRYALSAILGIVADEDDDGNAAVETSRKAKHSKDFKDGGLKWIFPKLKELGLEYEVVSRYTEAYRKGRLSAMDKAEVERLLVGLSDGRSVTRKHFNAWIANNPEGS